MNEIAITDIPLDSALDCYICHSSGEILHAPGEIITKSHRVLMHECEIESVLVLSSETEADQVKKEVRRQKVSIDAIPIDEPVPLSLYGADGAMVIDEGKPFTESEYSELKTTGVTELLYEKDPIALNSLQFQKYRMLLESDKIESLAAVADPDRIMEEKESEAVATIDTPSAEELQHEAIPEERFLLSPSKQISTGLCKQLMQQPAMLTVASSEQDVAQPASDIVDRDAMTTAGFNRRYWKWASDIEALFGKLKTNKETEFEMIEEVARDIIDCYYQDGRYCLNLMNLRHPPASERYLSTHAINTAIAAAGIGARRAYPLPLVRELVVGALLHDIGHLLTYRPFLAKRDLDSPEQQKYDQHVTVGMAMLKNIAKIPVSTMLVVAQHHERPDGSGRIFHARADQVHDFARIVAVVDSYETGCRFYNATASLAFTVRDAQAGKNDLSICKDLLSLLSIYPIGIALKTSDGTICKVIGTHPDSFKKPLLRSVYTMQDDHLFPINKQELFDLKRVRVDIVKEICHSALKSDIAAGFQAC